MPFTPSHVAAVLPFVGGRLPAAALVVGSMTPDLFYYLPGGPSRGFAHSLTGAVTVDLPLAVGLFVVWQVVFRRPLVDLAPRWLRSRLGGRRGTSRNARQGYGWRGAVAGLAAVIAVVIGIATHLLWDAFTHEGWASDLMPWLAVDLGPLPLHDWLQHVSTIAGAVVLLVWLIVWVRKTPRSGGPDACAPTAVRVVVWLLVVGVGAGAGVALLAGGLSRGETAADDGLLFVAATRTVAWAALVAVACCAVWWVARGVRAVAR